MIVSGWHIAIDEAEHPTAVLPLDEGVRVALLKADAVTLRTFVVDVAQADGDVYKETYFPAGDPGTLQMMVPRTRWHVRIGAPTATELEQVFALAALIFTTTGDWRKASAATLHALRSRISGLRPEFGELSVVEAIARQGVATNEQIRDHLQGRQCPRHTVGCVLMSQHGRCEIDDRAINEIVGGLVARNVIARRGPLSPPRYEVVA